MSVIVYSKNLNDVFFSKNLDKHTKVYFLKKKKKYWCICGCAIWSLNSINKIFTEAQIGPIKDV